MQPAIPIGVQRGCLFQKIDGSAALAGSATAGHFGDVFFEAIVDGEFFAFLDFAFAHIKNMPSKDPSC